MAQAYTESTDSYSRVDDDSKTKYIYSYNHQKKNGLFGNTWSLYIT